MQIPKSHIIVLLIILASSCNPAKVTKVDRNLSYSYNPTTSTLNPKFDVFHNNPNTSILTFKLFTAELLFNEANPESELRAEFLINLKMFEVDSKGIGKSIVDSTLLKFEIPKEKSTGRFLTDIEIKAEKDKLYLCEIYTTDLLRRTVTRDYLYVNKLNQHNHQNFRVINAKNSLPMFEPYVVGGNDFKIIYPFEIDSFFVSFHRISRQLPRPVFYEEQAEKYIGSVDSIWKIPNSEFFIQSFEEEGLYFIQADTAMKDGLTLLNFGDGFPKVTSVDKMVGPLAYITTSIEYKELLAQKNRKLAIDNFWLDKVDNIERARELIRIYYTRVYLANYYFSSYKEGWKTDRGMVYIIYGPPNSMETNHDSERWIYYKKNNNSPVTFTFRREGNEYSSELFSLKRSESYNISWRQSVNNWRNGDLFLLEN
jgi:GWxTD domain-containing protein